LHVAGGLPNEDVSDWTHISQLKSRHETEIALGKQVVDAFGMVLLSLPNMWGPLPSG
jgi:hypothetical protein